jgi:hypothetical protein
MTSSLLIKIDRCSYIQINIYEIFREIVSSVDRLEMKIFAAGNEGNPRVRFLVLESFFPLLLGIEDCNFNALMVPAQFLVLRSIAFLPFWPKWLSRSLLAKTIDESPITSLTDDLKG